MTRARFVLVVIGTLVGGCDGPEAVSEASDAIGAREAGRWRALGGDLGADPTAYLSRPSLVAAPLMQPTVAFSRLDPATSLDTSAISRWLRAAWQPLGAFDGTAPAIAVDGRERLLVCYGPGPFVKRWNGSSWIDLGNDISSETGYRGVQLRAASGWRRRLRARAIAARGAAIAS